MSSWAKSTGEVIGLVWFVITSLLIEGRSNRAPSIRHQDVGHRHDYKSDEFSRIPRRCDHPSFSQSVAIVERTLTICKTEVRRLKRLRLQCKQHRYNAKAHPHLSPPGELLIRYNVDSSDFWGQFKNADIYRPRFIRLKWSD